MNAFDFKFVALASAVFVILSACASNFAVFESPTAGPLSQVTVVNEADTQNARFATFDDGRSCTRRRHIQYHNGAAISTGESLSFSVAARTDFALFASLDRISSDEYGVDVGITGGGPAPLITRTVSAIGCNAIVSFETEVGKSYRVVVSEPATSTSCSIAVTEVSGAGEGVAIEAIPRVARFPRDELGSFCAFAR